MSKLAFVVDVQDYSTSDLARADFLTLGREVARQVRGMLPAAEEVTLDELAVGSTITINPDVQSAIVAGDSAGSITVAGVTTASILIAVLAIKDADQTTDDFTSEFGSLDGAINNTGGSDTTAYHLIVIWR